MLTYISKLFKVLNMLLPTVMTAFAMYFLYVGLVGMYKANAFSSLANMVLANIMLSESRFMRLGRKIRDL